MTNAVDIDTHLITVERLEVEHSGSKNGRPWTRYVVHGTDEHGHPLHNCKTFDSLPVGRVRVTFEPFMKDGVRQNWTLKLADKARKPIRATASGVVTTTDVDERISQLESKVASLEAKLNAILRGLKED